MKAYKVLADISASGVHLKPGDIIKKRDLKKKEAQELIKNGFLEETVIESPKEKGDGEK